MAHLERVIGLGEGEALRRVLVDDLRAGDGVLQLLAQLGAIDGDVDDARPVEPEHDLTLKGIGGVVEVHDCPRQACQGLVSALDELLAALHQHLHGDVVGHQFFFDQLAAEVVVGLAGRRETDLDLLEPHLHQGFEEAALALRVHRVDEGLVSVAQVDTAPAGSLVLDLVRPGAVGQHEGHEAFVLPEGHLLGGGGLGGHRVGRFRVGVVVGKSKKPRPFGWGCGRAGVCAARPT